MWIWSLGCDAGLLTQSLHETRITALISRLSDRKESIEKPEYTIKMHWEKKKTSAKFIHAANLGLWLYLQNLDACFCDKRSHTYQCSPEGEKDNLWRDGRQNLFSIFWFKTPRLPTKIVYIFQIQTVFAELNQLTDKRICNPDKTWVKCPFWNLVSDKSITGYFFSFRIIAGLMSLTLWDLIVVTFRFLQVSLSGTRIVHNVQCLDCRNIT